jgi:transcriptional regulator with XRE-family HTH domain
MISESTEKINKRHIGRNIQKVRVYLGVKQDALATDLGISQQAVSNIEQQDDIDDGLLSKIAGVLGVSAEVIKDFDLERAIYNINSYKDATISDGAITTVYAASQQFNPIEKIVELYERLLKSEKEKIEILMNNRNSQEPGK